MVILIGQVQTVLYIVQADATHLAAFWHTILASFFLVKSLPVIDDTDIQHLLPHPGFQPDGEGDILFYPVDDRIFHNGLQQQAHHTGLCSFLADLRLQHNGLAAADPLQSQIILHCLQFTVQWCVGIIL